MTRVLLIGGHGKVALRTLPLLVGAGHEVDAVIRNPDHSEDIAATGANPVVADVASLDVDGLADLVGGHDVVVWSAGAGGGSAEKTYAVDRDAAIRTVDASAQAGVGHFVMVSYFGARPDHGVSEDNSFFAYAEAKSAADEYLRASPVPWTVLGPSTLTLDEPTGEITVGGESDQVSRANVGIVITDVIGHGPTSATIRFNDGDTPIREALEAVRPD